MLSAGRFKPPPAHGEGKKDAPTGNRCGRDQGGGGSTSGATSSNGRLGPFDVKCWMFFSPLCLYVFVFWFSLPFWPLSVRDLYRFAFFLFGLFGSLCPCWPFTARPLGPFSPNSTLASVLCAPGASVCVFLSTLDCCVSGLLPGCRRCHYFVGVTTDVWVS